MNMLFQAAQRQPFLKRIIGNHDVTPVKQPHAVWPGFMNRNAPIEQKVPEFEHIVAPATKQEMIDEIERVMWIVRPYLGLNCYSEAERTLQEACWDEWVTDIPGLATTLQRLRQDVIDIDQAEYDINRCIDLLNMIL